MIDFLLMLHFCTSATDCRWVRVDRFVREEICHEVGHAYCEDEQVVGYKCVLQVEESWRK